MMTTTLEQAWGPTIKRAFGNSLFVLKNDVEVIYDPWSKNLQVGMGGEWWSGPIKGPGKHVFHHRKERVDDAYRPVTVVVRKQGHAFQFDVMGGFGMGTSVTFGLT